jgi:flagellar FliL protein
MLNKKTIGMVLGGLLAVGASVLGTLYATGNLTGGGAEASIQAAAGAEPPTPAPHEIIYVSLDPAFTMSFLDSDAAQFLQISVEVAVDDQKTEQAMASHGPAIRNGLVMLLSNQQPETLQTREGKERLRGEILAEVRGVLTGLIGKPGAVDVYFTSFLIQ